MLPEPRLPQMPEMDLRGFKCLQCHACCRQTGYVRLAPDEPDRIAAFLAMDVREFIEAYTCLTQDRQTLSLTEQEDGACIFLDQTTGCRIQGAKPGQCRDFPQKWRFSDFQQVCGWAKRQGKGGGFPCPGLR